MEKYERLHQIGQGNFGSVFLVRQAHTGERLVVKQVNTAKITQSELQKVWDEEFRVYLTRLIQGATRGVSLVRHAAPEHRPLQGVLPLRRLRPDRHGVLRRG